MSRKILISGLSILASLGIVTAATYAYFSDTATSTANTFVSGTLNLLVDDIDDTAAETVDGSITAANFSPGATTSGFISLHNPGTLPIAEVELAADTTETADPGANSDLSTVLNLDVLVDDGTPDSACVGGTNVTSAIDTAVGNGSTPLTLSEFDNGGTDVYDALLTGTGLAVSATKNICFNVTFDLNAGDIYQGDAVSTLFTFTANQHVDQ